MVLDWFGSRRLLLQLTRIDPNERDLTPVMLEEEL